MYGRVIVSGMVGCMIVGACLSAKGGDIEAKLDTSDGTTAFIVLDANSNELFRIASDGSVVVGKAGASLPMTVKGNALVEGALGIAATNAHVHVGNVGSQGSAAGWDPNPKKSQGLWLETGLDGEGSGFYLDDDMIALWSPGDNDILRLYDEDRLPAGQPHLVVDAEGNIGVGVTNTASSRLRVAGRIESTSAGFKFPDGSVQTTAATGGGVTGWELGGNAGTAAGTNFIGTTDNMALEVRVNNQQALRLEPHASGPNVIGGSSANSAAMGTAGGVIGGGLDNAVAASYATVGGGYDNMATNNWATVAGGSVNIAGGARSAVGGGQANKAYGGFSAIGGGSQNEARGDHAYVAGGTRNVANGNTSLAAGNRAKALHDGTFVWADSQAADFSSTGTNQFLVRAKGGVGINTGSPGDDTLHVRGDRVRIYHASAQYGSTAGLYLGDQELAYVKEDEDDKLTIYGDKRIALMGGKVGVGTDNPDQKLSVAGTVESMTGGFKFPDGTLQATAAGSGIPTGVICMWSGTLANIPSGWALCNGTGGTPDLTDRFVMGTSTGVNPGGVGGSASHSHTVDIGTVTTSGENQRPPFDLYNSASHVEGSPMLNTINAHLHDVSIGTKSSSTETHLPPYYKIAFIMKQ